MTWVASALRSPFFSLHHIVQKHSFRLPFLCIRPVFAAFALTAPRLAAAAAAPSCQCATLDPFWLLFLFPMSTCEAPTYTVGALERNQDAAAHISHLFEQGGPGTKVLLQPATQYHLQNPIVLSHDGQELATLDYPEDDEWKASLLTVGSQADAIVALNRSHVCIRNLIVDGQEPHLGSSEKREPLILLGGPQSQRPTIQDCVLKHPRGWTCLHIADFAVGAKVIRNHVGPAGHPAPAGPWADGISFAGRDGVVSGNTVVDSTWAFPCSFKCERFSTK